MFPVIHHIKDLLPFVIDNKQIRAKVCEETGLTIVSYMVQDEDTFTGKNAKYEAECRGITFHPDGTVAARTLHKFFNIGQREDVQPDSMRWQDVTTIMPKRDGSMVTPVLIDRIRQTWRMKTKKSFTTKEAALAEEVARAKTGGSNWIVHVLEAQYTPTFEITSKRYPIVLKYETDELWLLAIRHNATGRYLEQDEIDQRFPYCPFPMVPDLKAEFTGEGVPANLVSWDKLHKFAMEATMTEGLVIRFGQELVKLKTKWYCDLHHAVTFTTKRAVARAVLADRSDDLKAAFALSGRDPQSIIDVEDQINREINVVRNAVEAHAENGHGLQRTAKDMALAFKDHELFSLVMAEFRGKEIHWFDWYLKNHISEWSLEVIDGLD